MRLMSTSNLWVHYHIYKQKCISLAKIYQKPKLKSPYKFFSASSLETCKKKFELVFVL